MPPAAAPRVAVLGAGPVGLEAALYARKLGLPATVYERGRAGEHVLRWGHVRLFSPFGMNVTPLGRATLRAANRELPGDGDLLTGAEHAAAYLAPLAQCGLLANCLKLETEVRAIGRSGLLKGDLAGDPAKRGRHAFRLLLREKSGEERVDEADVVLDCTGTYGQHRWLGDGGLPALGETAAAPHVAYGLEDVLGKDRPKYAGKTVLVVGAGYSAATHVCRLADLAVDHQETWIVWLARGSRTQPMPRLPNDPLKERDRLAVRANTLATRGEGHVEFHASSVVDRLQTHGPDKGFTVTARVAGKPKTWEVDRVVASVGYAPDGGLCRELQAQECPASQGPAALKHPEPNFFALGAKSYGRNSQFLLRNGFDQVREVFTLIAGDPKLDLYGK